MRRRSLRPGGRWSPASPAARGGQEAGKAEGRAGLCAHLETVCVGLAGYWVG